MPSDAQPIKIAILAMGGEGGGVLADWIVDLGEHAGWIAQTTSVPGVAQRTGATIYYVELYPRAAAERDGGHPVLALMPMPGDVDIVLASELMEAGRAVQRGLVTPDRTTLVASTHRVYSITEKTAMGDGRVDPATLLDHASSAAKQFVRFDMAAVAEETRSVISAALFGALAATGALPFGRSQFEATVTRGGVGVKTSLAAFDAAYARAQAPMGEPAPVVVATPVGTPRDPAVRALLARLDDFPEALRGVLVEGLRKLVDYQDAAYGSQYLDRVRRVVAVDRAPFTLAAETARHLALWMAYEDTIRVADLKTRGTRFARVAGEVRAQPGQIVDIEEFMHPRLQEICETLPAAIGAWLQKPGWARRFVEARTTKGRRIATSSIRGFLMLRTIAGLRRWRRGTLRFKAEQAAIDAWLARILEHAVERPQLALEIAQCQRLVKGYSDTHARGTRNFTAIMAVVERTRGAIAPTTVRELRDAALADEHGVQLQAALARHALV